MERGAPGSWHRVSGGSDPPRVFGVLFSGCALGSSTQRLVHPPRPGAGKGEARGLRGRRGCCFLCAPGREPLDASWPRQGLSRMHLTVACEVPREESLVFSGFPAQSTRASFGSLSSVPRGPSSVPGIFWPSPPSSDFQETASLEASSVGITHSMDGKMEFMLLLFQECWALPASLVAWPSPCPHVQATGFFAAHPWLACWEVLLFLAPPGPTCPEQARRFLATEGHGYHSAHL